MIKPVKRIFASCHQRGCPERFGIYDPDTGMLPVFVNQTMLLDAALELLAPVGYDEARLRQAMA